MQPIEPQTFLFSGYARLPHEVSHQPVQARVGVILEVGEDGIILDVSSTLLTALARDYFCRLLKGRSVLTDRQAIETIVRYRYRGHSQGALIFALRRAFEAIDQSPLASACAKSP
ncbi:MAG: DUF3870 domain-containing protein [Gaiellales bacterium]|nr:DUF3870 domain-containing protein [Gaiellales bacterium]